MNVSPSLATEAAELSARFAGRPPEELLAWAVERYGDRVALACSLGMEDVALVDMLARVAKSPQIFVLDTGRLHEESYETLDSLRSRYGISIEVYFPDAAAVQNLMRAKGAYSFYESIENRKECCGVRKVEPLGRALAGRAAWITGMRREQAVTRGDLGLVEVDPVNAGLLKFNPLADWTLAQLEAYVKEHQVPLHPLHAKGYPSIGCAPCTRAIQPGEDLRAGRWWWESADTKECGLHVKK